MSVTGLQPPRHPRKRPSQARSAVTVDAILEAAVRVLLADGYPRLTTPLLVAILLITTYVTAGLMHNVTSILIMTPIIIRPACGSFSLHRFS